ncbi:MAG: Na(+)-translocating NADH-quinone reductase subunit F [Flavobacteriales bacterium]
MKQIELTKSEIHYLGMNYIGEILQNEGYEFLAVNSQLKKHPQFVCFKKGEPTSFVLVKTVLFPENPDLYNQKLIEKFKQHAKKNQAKVWYVGVSLSNAEDSTKPLFKGNSYQIKSTGFQTIL